MVAEPAKRSGASRTHLDHLICALIVPASLVSVAALVLLYMWMAVFDEDALLHFVILVAAPVLYLRVRVWVFVHRCRRDEQIPFWPPDRVSGPTSMGRLGAFLQNLCGAFVLANLVIIGLIMTVAADDMFFEGRLAVFFDYCCQ